MELGSFIAVVVKPTLSCNLQCRHCYHGGSGRPREVMDAEMYERIVDLVSTSYDSASFIWHGGEPLMARRDFFRKAMAIQKKYFGERECSNIIRTNGTLLDSHFVRFCKDNRVSIGISYEAGFERGLRPGLDVKFIDSMVKYITKEGCASFVNATVHGNNIRDMKEIYQRVRTMGVPLSFNPIINLGNACKHPELKLDADEYAQNLNEVYDVWLHDGSTNTPIIPFMQCINAILNESQSIFDCSHTSCLMKWICVYPNGDVYPCGKACPESFYMGNIARVKRVEDLFESDGFRNILVGSIERRKKCQGCEVYRYCNGGCSIDFMADGNIEDNNSFSCEVYKRTFKHIRSTLDNIMKTRPSMSCYNRFIRDFIIGKLVSPRQMPFSR